MDDEILYSHVEASVAVGACWRVSVSTPLPSRWPARADKNETATSIKHQARVKRALNSNFSCFPLLGHLEI